MVRRESCEMFVSVFNKVSGVFGFKASLNGTNIEVRDDKGLLTSYDARKYIPIEVYPLFFDDRAGNKIQSSYNQMGLYLRKTDGFKSYTINYNNNLQSFAFSYNDTSCLNRNRKIEYSDVLGELHIRFGNTWDSKLPQAMQISVKNDPESRVFVLTRDGFDEDEKGFIIGETASTIRGRDQKNHLDINNVISRLREKDSEEAAKDAISNPVVNKLIWDALNEMDSLFPGVLDFLKANTEIERTLRVENKPNSIAKFIIDQSEIGSFELTKGTEKVREGE